MAGYFELLLVIATLGTGIVWAIDHFVFLPKRRAVVAGLADTIEQDAKDKVLQESALVENCRGVFPVIGFVLVLRSFFYEPFQIPSGSMMPTLLVGDFILVEKYAYGVKLPVLRNKVIETGAPQRGDSVVFKYPPQPTVDYIKRVIGLPGDTVLYRNKRLYIKRACAADNNVELTPCDKFEEVSIDIVSQGDFIQDSYPLTEAHENLLGVNHQILFNPAFAGRPEYFNQTGARQGEWIVPQGQYFVMGDNRDNSLDSRFWGFVPEQNMVGKAVFIWTSFEFNRSENDWLPTWVPSGIRTDRIGKIG
ncbi:signal peptidase I [Psychrobium sp. 1_MG-2023]|uniref:signal peptidase I n=1 Tax=Psychrobium sp. 1_MG-2023 TaxID=3062624 RepID=UPI000C31BDFE|nr:signal peptidase I [Psychrobium sp. 1_MG-2023]MDP2560889.1 signal peptidase I [Psychrobium sp. 1_MG-2023]PKF55964.1 signal peptidase I [Alteromonadales bacterium alter-6D02]